MVKLGDILVCSVEEGERSNQIKLVCSVVQYSKNEEREEERADSGPFEGIVVDEDRAKITPCYRINGTNLIFSKGIIGALSKEQVEKYCPEIIEKPPSGDVICAHLEDFDKIVKAIEEKLKKRGLM